MNLVIKNGEVFHDGDLEHTDIEIQDGVIQRVDSDIHGGDEVIDASGCIVIPAATDIHVHFREPGYPYKETWGTGSRAAARGGVTTVVDQPNTDPPTIDSASFKEKERHASLSIVDYGLNAGVTPTWKPEELLDEDICMYGEVFMADSTGEMGIGLELFTEAVEYLGSHGCTVSVHAEDSSYFEDISLRKAGDWSKHRPPMAEIEAVRKAIEIAGDTRLHFAHISHPESVDLIASTHHTCEATPHHLFLCQEDLEELGTYGKMNPPLRTRDEMYGMRERIDLIDCVATDHAPHTRDEKNQGIGDAPSGVPGVETALPLLLYEVIQGGLDLSEVIRLMCKAPNEIIDVDKGVIRGGYPADIVIVEMREEEITDEELETKPGWTPFNGYRGVFPDIVLCRGTPVYRDGEFMDNNGEIVYPGKRFGDA